MTDPRTDEEKQNVPDLIASPPTPTYALVFGERRLTRAEFDARVAGLGRELIAAGVGPEVAVGVQIDRSVELLVAIHAVIAAGGHYVPLDARLPDDRSRYMVATSGAALVLVADGLDDARERYDGLAVVRQISCSGPFEQAAPISDSERTAPVLGDTAAYTLFTSGSTGRPKGVTVAHEAIANRLEWMHEWYSLGSGDVFVQKTPITFDVSVWELFLPVALGATLVIAEPGGHGDPEYMADLIRAEAVTAIHFVPSMLAAFTDVLGERLRELTSVRTLFTSGEALTASIAAPVLTALPSLELHNLYGPTEAAVDVTAQHVAFGSVGVPIGVPVPATSTYVLDQSLSLVPAGVPGELYLGGVQLARGYAARTDLTSERFIADPFGEPGSRLYRTGDLVRWNNSGEIEYLGRTDFQVKLRGQRIELGEVEAAIADAPGVVHAAAAVVDSPGGQQLVGYVAPDHVDIERLAESVAQRLPEYMRPTTWVRLAEMPLGTAGKVDRRALPAPEFGTVEYVAPETSDEHAVAKLFADLLGLDRASVTESFFDLGGNSLAATRIAARVSDELGVDVKVRDVFDAPSVRELVATVSGRAPALPALRRAENRPTMIPLSFAQQRMWFINRFDPSTGMYNIPVVLRVTGALDVVALRNAVGDVVARHETLRTTFPDLDGQPFQMINPVEAIEQHLDWRHVGSVDAIEDAVARGFELSREWPIRVRIWEAAPGEYVLAVVMHHIASDGQSFAPLVGDLITAYVARAAGEAPIFVPLEVQFADFAIWQHEVLGSPDDSDSIVGQQLTYWREQLAGLPDVLDLPSDRPRPQTATGRGAQTDFTIPADVADGITRLAARHGVTPYMVVHAALAVVLGRLSGSDDLAIGAPFAGRGQRALDPLVGMFVNTVVLRSQVDTTDSFADHLAAIRNTDLAAFAHADAPFEAVVDAVDPARSEAFAPLAQVWLSVEGGATGDTAVDLQDQLTVEPFESGPVIAKVDMLFGVNTAQAGESWDGSVVYATDLFDESTVAATAERLTRVLASVVRDPDVLVGDIEMLSESEHTQIEEWAGIHTFRIRPDGTGTLADLLEHFELGSMHRTAVVDGDRTITYRELADRTNVLARQLIDLGVGPDVAVAVSVPRSLEMVITAHAVITAGGHYVPVAIDAPAERARYIVDTAGAQLVLVSAYAPDVADWADPATRVLEIDASGPIVGDTSGITDADRIAPLHVDDAMYTIFTSGSTGRPKGVTVSHSAAMAMLHADHHDHSFTADDVVLAVLDFTFDPSVLDLFRPAISAGKLVIVGQGEQRDPWAMRAYVERHQVTSIMVVPSMLALMLTELSDDELATMRSIRTVQLGGEALSPAVADAMHRAWPQSQLHNQYGPTETIVYSTIAEIGPGAQTVPIGRPTVHSTAQILDARLRPVPVGVPGELYLGGSQIARGYTGRSGLTAERFVADPAGLPGYRMYRTGDVVRWAPDGQIEYLGRIDFQVKLRGQRIELGEIESVIAAAPGVREVAAEVVDMAPGGQSLVAYVTARPDTTETDLRDFASEHLLQFMRPAIWMLLDDMPVNAAGKVDRKRLPEPVVTEFEYVGPANRDEELVAAVFGDILGLDRVSVTESFFDLGGTSLNAARLASRTSAALGAEIRIRDVFDATTVRELVAASAGRTPALPPVTPVVPRPNHIPLSFAQQRMWFINRFEPENSTYNLPNVLRLTGPLDLEALRAAFTDLVTRHEVLRTSFPAVDGVPGQVIGATDTVTERLDWGLAGSMADIEAAVTTGFDLSREWPIRIRIWPVGADEHVLAIVVHHIGADGESLRPLIGDLVAAYIARRGGLAPEFVPLEVQFADYAIWQHQVLGSPDDPGSVAGRQLDYWRDALAGIPDLLELPYDRSRPKVASGQGAATGFEIPADVARRIEAVAGQVGATPFMVLNAALATLLARMSATDDVTIATPVAGRAGQELDAVIGMFVNTLVLRSRMDLGETFADLVVRTRSNALAAFENADVPFETVVDAVNPVRSEAFAPLAQVMLTLDPGAAAQSVEIPVGDLVFSGVETDTSPAQVDLTFMVNSAQTGDWHGAVVFATDLFDESTAQTLAERFVALLDGLTADIDVAVGDVPMLDAGEISALRAVEVGEDRHVRAEDLASALADSVAAHADRDALVFQERTVTYGEFGARVNVLARELIRAGVGPDVAVVVCIPRSVELMVAVHAVVAAGGQYVPVDTATPADRVEYMMSTAGAKVALVHAGESVPGPIAGLGESITVMAVDAGSPVDLAAPPVTDAERIGALRPAHAAYTIFTSGSTGRPKGVTLPHDAVVNRLRWGLDELPIDGDDLVVLKTPYTFDCSVAELFAPLMQGSRLLIAEPDGHLDPVYMADLIADSGATMVHFVPSMLSVFLELAGPERLARLDRVRIISTTGEALPPAVAAETRAAVPGAVLYNLYGPTEAAVEITYQRLDEIADTVPIGVPVWNSTAYVLDGRLNPVAAGVPGELYVGGVQLARGYADRPDLTSDRFLADPFGPAGTRMYRTGDLVRRNQAGELEYLGRTDFQVKLRGQRIELGEIEAAIAQAPGVVHTSVTVAQAPDGGEHLVAYVAGAPGELLDLDAIRSAIATPLPEYMRPTVWMPLDEIPLNSAGKIDRKSLPAPEFSAGEYVAPETADEEAVAGAFADVLGVDRIGVTDSFFDLGGNSLSAMRLAARAGDALGVQVSVRDVFEAPSVRELVAATAGRTGGLPPVTRVQPRPEMIPLSFAQQRMWVINQLDSGSGMYNIPAVLRLTGSLDVPALRAAIGDLVVRHEVLRTTFPQRDGSPYQRIAAEVDAVEQIDWAVVDGQSGIERAVDTGFDLENAYPLRVRLWEVADGEHVLAVVAHHIAADGESTTPLVGDLITAYFARTAGHEPAFVPLEVQIADFAIWQRTVLGDSDDEDSVVSQQLAYWKERLAGLPSVIDLPTDRPRPAVASGRGSSVEFEIPGDVVDGVNDLANGARTTSFIAVHSALAVLLSRFSGQDEVAVGSPIAGRGDPILDPLVGMFVNMLTLRTDIDPASRFRDVLAATHAGDVEAFANADIPFEEIVDALDVERSQAFAPLSQVWLTVADEGVDPEASITGPLTVEPVGTENTPAKVDLHVHVSTSQTGSWRGSILYATDLYDAATVRDLADRFVEMLRTVTDDPTVAVRDIDLGGTDGLTPVSVGDPTPPVLLGDLFRTAARRAPERTAVVDGFGAALSYAELDARSNRLARWLIGRGVGPERPVALAIVRSIELLTAIWAVAKTGGCYVPIDPEYPADRVAGMIEDSGAVLGLTTARTGDLPSDGFDWVQLDDADIRSAVDAVSEAAVTPGELVAQARPENLAYVIYTSGSTGRPKGVAVTHSGLSNFAEQESQRLDAGDGSVVLGFASPSFDASVLEYLLATVNAGTLVYRTADAVGGAELERLIADSGVTHTFLTPSVLATLDPDRVPSLRSIAAGGEAVPQSIVDRWAPVTTIRNLYGPTETTIGITISTALAADVPVRLGGPIGGVGLTVLDGQLRPTPVGVPGELYVSGPALSRGYLDRPGLTADRFVADPHGQPGDRMYRTGDVVRWQRTAVGSLTLEYTGRSDDQVKLRGLRIELGEIESALTGHPAVQSAVVVGVGGSVATALAAYVVPADGTDVDGDELKEFVGRSLPAHMVPSSVAVLDAFPLTPVGKLDKRALPEPVIERVEFVAPATETERAVAQVFADVLDVSVDEVSVDAGFFDLGGNSLAAARVVSRLREAVGTDVQLAWLFDDATVRGLARRIAGGDVGLNSVLIGLRTDGAQAPLFCVHPAGGLAWFFGGLVPYLTDRPVYGLQDPHVVADEVSVTDVPTLAARYVDELRTVQPEGPYHLLGWSIGGTLAYEMARQLREAGQRVGYLGVMDASLTVEASAEPTEETSGGDTVGDLLGSWRDLFDLGDDVHASSPEEVAAVVRDQIAGMGLLAADQVERVMTSFATSGQMLEGFRPERYRGDVHYFTATADKTDPEGFRGEWAKYVDGSIENVDVPTHHLGMADAEALAIVGPAVDRALRRSVGPARD
ncbi:amino acid adenylation domain-containing protein [Gordonia sp. HY002]|uniref:non-ribosomal peptide synthetase n=4 Tax=Gordonia zhenghanii TaxID=2911516 RepID=UPI001F45A835|nr:non-ribosomal peptide synthetase [Gordonia zhenghanii]MCF8568746.1 amino acid adenylation domain-containing protein [Gordonia zhenghanii]